MFADTPAECFVVDKYVCDIRLTAFINSNNVVGRCRVQLDDGGGYRIIILAKPDRIIKRDILVIGE